MPKWPTGHWRAWPSKGTPDFSTAKMAGVVSSVLFVLCGLMVAAFGPLVPSGRHVHALGVVAVGITAALAGVVIAALPWERWRRASTLWLIPLAFALIALHNCLTGANGFRYDVFYFVVYVWIGLMHPAGTAVKSAPLLVLSYLAPALWLNDLSTLVGAMTYAAPVCLLVGECASMVATVIQRSEADVRASEQRLLALVHNSSDVVMVVDRDCFVRWDSPSVEAVLGYAPEERVGTDGMEYVRPEHLPAAYEALNRLLEEPQALRTVELQVRHKDGSWRWCVVRVRNLLDDPAVAGFVVNMTDVTERHEADDIRRQLAAIVESSRDAIVGQTLDGTILSWNSAAEHMYLYPAEQMLDANIDRLVPPDRIEELHELLAQVALGYDGAVETQQVRQRRGRRRRGAVDVTGARRQRQRGCGGDDRARRHRAGAGAAGARRQRGQLPLAVCRQPAADVGLRRQHDGVPGGQRGRGPPLRLQPGEVPLPRHHGHSPGRGGRAADGGTVNGTRSTRQRRLAPPAFGWADHRCRSHVTQAAVRRPRRGSGRRTRRH